MLNRNTGTLIGGVGAAIAAGLAARYGFGLDAPAAWTAGITTLCAAWWIFEPIPIPVTSLIPFIAFPLVGVLNQTQVAEAYGHKLVLLFLGGFILSKAMEKSGAHRRVALIMVRAVGGGGGRLMVLGFMLASAVLSMWISNTATVLMMLPIILAVLAQTREDKDLAIPLLLGVAYAASIGGIGTPIGTPPNGVFLAEFGRRAKEMEGVQQISFFEWMTIGLPVVVVLLPVAWLWLTRRIKGRHDITLPHPGAWRAEERRVLTLFAITALLWITRAEPYGGWTALLKMALGVEKLDIYDSTVALLMVLVMFLVPNGKGEKLLDWETAVKIPWGILILFGGGIAIAKAFSASGLSEAVGGALGELTSMHVIMMIAVLCLVVTFLTEVTSNTATASVLMPILAAAAIGADMDMRLLMIPAAVSCSCAFMLPVATPPNAIVFSSGHVTVRQMAREGLVLNFIGVAIVTVVMYLRLGM